MSGWTDWYLWAPDETAAKAAATETALLDDTGAWVTAGPNHAFLPDVRIEAMPAAIDDGGEIVTPAALEPGWFANLRIRDGADVSALIAAAAALGVAIRLPNTPRVVWA